MTYDLGFVRLSRYMNVAVIISRRPLANETLTLTHQHGNTNAKPSSAGDPWPGRATTSAAIDAAVRTQGRPRMRCRTVE